MISCFLAGGLGNQMFQIAATYAHASKNRDTCAFDLKQGNFTQKPAYFYKDSIYFRVKETHLSDFEGRTKYYEPQFNYTSIPYEQGMLLHGHFQSEKYFCEFRNEILELFLNSRILTELRKKFASILVDSVSMHIRRGDYLLLSD
ncbi:alpha-1,2-fucosyltransferase, partial [Pseudomonadota bacterium]